MLSGNYKIKNKKGICLRPPIYSKGESIINRILPITENKNTEIVRIQVLAGAKDYNPEIEKYNGGVRIKTSITYKNPQTMYCICLNPEVMSNTGKFTWTIIEDLISGLTDGIKNHPELRFYITYLEIIDKGTEPNFPHTICLFRKIFTFAAESEVGMKYAPEKKSLDLEAIYRNPEWIDETKGGYWKKHRNNLIPDIYLNLPIAGAKYVEAGWAKRHAHNLTYLKDVFMVRACDLKEYTVPSKVYQALPEGKCYEVDIEDVYEDV
ncbi:hypothetical protein LCGC14_1922480 [marine sediment metagenome]|uniref:Uncharacterized protein n=1 Tax=marine sediment metagenome TaxID=412755 RepID=A0A0F9FR37_9ZZZZ